MRDAIFFTGWTWNAFNAPERVALAMAHLGARVLYFDNPTSFFRDREPVQLKEVADNIYETRPRHWGHRFNYFPPLQRAQTKYLANQFVSLASTLKLRDPIFFYCNLSRLAPLCKEMKRHFFSAYLRIDYLESDSDYFAEVSDATLAIPKSVFHKLKARFGDKVKLIPQAVDLRVLSPSHDNGSPFTPEMECIPHPRLGYLGPPNVGRLNETVLTSLLQAHPEWHMVSIGSRAVPLSNAHALARVGSEGLANYLYGFDVGFLPYDCYNEQWLHCVPLKLFEYFALGMPVVSTPLINLWEYKDLIYFGETAGELASAIKAALNEAPDSPKRRRRKEIANNHSIQRLANVLSQVLPLNAGTRVDSDADSLTPAIV